MAASDVATVMALVDAHARACVERFAGGKADPDAARQAVHAALLALAAREAPAARPFIATAEPQPPAPSPWRTLFRRKGQ